MESEKVKKTISYITIWSCQKGKIVHQLWYESRTQVMRVSSIEEKFQKPKLCHIFKK